VMTLRQAATIIARHGLHRGPNFATRRPRRFDLCAALYLAAEGSPAPAALYGADPHAARDLIEASPDAMTAIVTVSNSLATEPPTSEVTGVDGQIAEVTEYIEHLADWTDYPGPGNSLPPTDTEVINLLQRLAGEVDKQTTAQIGATA